MGNSTIKNLVNSLNKIIAFCNHFLHKSILLLSVLLLSTSVSLFAQTDTDGDTVIDSIDLDDDNDGILDLEECALEQINIPSTSVDATVDKVNLHTGSLTETLSHTYMAAGCTSSSFTTSYEVIAMPAQNAPNNTIICANIANSFDGFVNNTVGDWIRIQPGADTDAACDTDAGVGYRINFLSGVMPLDINNFGHGNFTAAEKIAIRAAVPLFMTTTSTGNLTGDGTTEVILDNVNGATGGTNNTWSVNSAGIDVSWFEIEVWGSVGQEGFSLPYVVACDADCDGIANGLDLDSDGDGCSDAAESGGIDADGDGVLDGTGFDAAGLVTGGTGGYDGVSGDEIVIGPDTDSDGLPDACDAVFNDIDNDGVPDSVDLDDDNDGILDTVECVLPVTGQVLSAATLGVTANVGAPGDIVDLDVSANFGLMPGSIIINATDVAVNIVNNLALAVAADVPATFTITGTVPVYIDVSHGGNLGAPGGRRDGFSSLDGTTYNYTGASEPGYIDVVDGNSYFVESTDGTGDGTITMNWRANDPGKKVQFFTTNTTAFNNNYTIRLRVCNDTDADGLPDYLDADSDNDGCTDVVESGGTDADGDGVLDGTGFDADGLVTGGTGGYDGATGDEILTGPDADSDGITDACDAVFNDVDNDGVPDSVDLDDDNDGILDTVEDACTNVAEAISAAAVNSSINNVTLHDGNSVPQILTQDFTVPGCTTASDQIMYTVTAFPSNAAANNTNICADVLAFVGAANANGDVIQIDKLAGCNGGIRYRIEFTSGAEVLNLTSLSHGNMASDEAIMITSHVPLFGSTFKRADADATNDGTNGGSIIVGGDGTTNTVSFDNVSGAFGGNLNVWEVNSGGVAVQWVEIDYYRSSDVPNASFEAFTLNHTPPCDNDCDGIANSLDLDSDNDGCPDYVEGDGTFTEDIGVAAQGTLTAGTGSTVSSNLGIITGLDPGVPAIAGSGQAVGSSQDASISNCLDTDGDGVSDAVDLDDDNDGILDIVEHGGIDPFNDADGDGIPDLEDPDAPGFVDVNADGIDDNFDTDIDGIINSLDLDSDGDGCPDAIEGGLTFVATDLATSTLDPGNRDGDDPFMDTGASDFTGTSFDGVQENLTGIITSTDPVGDGIVDANGQVTEVNGTAVTAVAQGIGTSLDVGTNICTDEDADGVLTIVEDAGPNGGDANNDGIPDSTQPNVASRPSLDGSYVALEAFNTVPANGDCTQIVRMTMISDKSLGEDGSFRYPLGLVDFSLECTGDGESAGVKFYWWGISSLESIDAYRKFGPSTAGGTDFEYRDASFIEATQEMENIEGTDVLTVIYDITDGLIGDDSLENSRIDDPTGPAVMPNDADGDGVPDTVDLDSDNDGILNSVECPAVAPTGGALEPDAVFYTDDLSRQFFTISGNTNGQGFSESGWDATVISQGGTIVADTNLTTTTFSNGMVTGSNDALNPMNTYSIIPTNTFMPVIPGGNTASLAFLPGVAHLEADNTLEFSTVIDFTTPVHSFGFDLVDNFDHGDGYVATWQIFIDGSLSYQIGPNTSIPIGATGTFQISDGAGNALGNITAGENLETFLGFLSPAAVSQIIIFRSSEFVGGGMGEELHGIGNFRYALEVPFDTDGDGISDCLDVDSDNDGCPDAIEGSDDVSLADLDADNEISGLVDPDGVPTVVNPGGALDVDGAQGQTAMGSTQPVELTLTTTPADQLIIDGGSVTFNATGQALEATTYTAGLPNFDGTATDDSANITYEWFVDMGAGFGTTPISIMQNLSLSPVTLAQSGYIYKVEITHPGNACPVEAQATLFIDPDNDGDGIGDSVDLDDDNDGILDTVECQLPTVGQVLNPTILGVTTNSGAPGDIVDLDVSSDFGLVAGSIIINATDVAVSTANSAVLSVADGVPATFTITGTVPVYIDITHGGNLGGVDNRDGFSSLDSATYTYTGATETGYTDNIVNNSYFVESDGTGDGTIIMTWAANDTGKKVQIFTTNSPAFNNNYFIRLRVCTDTDGDGLPDYLDADSDDDGCLDVIESGGVDGDGDGVLDGTGFDATGLVIGGTGGYDGASGDEIVVGPDADLDGISDACDTVFNDNDNDGIPDSVDLDDDNDGILDTVECILPTVGQVLNPTILGVTANSGAPGNIIDLDVSSNFGLLPGSIIINATDVAVSTANSAVLAVANGAPATFTITGTVPVYIDIQHGAILNVTGAMDGFTSIDGTAYTFTGGSEPGFTDNIVGNSYFVEADGTGDNNIVMNWAANEPGTSVQIFSTNSTSFLNNYFLRLRVCNDTDGDGLPDYLDLDSDNDGCADVLESGGTDDDGDDVLDGDGFNTEGQVTDGGAISDGYDGANGDEIVAVGLTTSDTTIPSAIAVTIGGNFTVSSDAVATQTNVWNTAAPFDPDYDLNPPVNATDVSGTLVYTWTFDDGTGAVPAAPTVTGQTFDFGAVALADAGTYEVTITHPDNVCISELRTIVLSVEDPNIALLKSGVYSDTNGDSIVNIGDEILYTFEVENTGNVDLTNITISDPLLVAPNGSISGGPINLAVGAIDTSTFTGVYAIQQTDIDAGAVLNSATATGSSPGGTDDVSDVSDDPNDATDTTDTDGDGDAEDDTSTALAQDPNIALLKSGVYSDTNGDSIVNIGDEILYTFEVENTGNVDLTNITISDPLLVAPNGSISGGPINLAVGAIDTSTFTGVYAIQQTDIDAGAVLNSATATGSSPGGTDDVSDVSDDPNDATDTTDTDGDGDAEDDTSTALAQDPNIALLKSGVYSDTNGDSIVNIGDEILYTFEVENTGNVDLTNITISDPLLVAPNGSISGGPINLAVGAIDTSTFTGVYAIQQTDIDAGAVLNSATATGSSPGGTDDVSDVSDDPNDATDTTDTDGDGDAEDDTSTALAQDPNIALLKSGVYSDTNGDSIVNVGDEILYTFEVENTGNVDLTNITISDPLLVAPNGSISGGPINLAVGAIDTSTFTGVYAIQQTDIDAGAVLNSATATGSSPGGTDDVSDVSDDPNDATDTTDTDGDGDAEDDTSTALAQDPNIALLKSGVYSDTNGDSIVNIGDEILYTFEVENTGNVDLTNITISDPLLVAPNGSISGGPINLAVDAIDTSTFTGVYAIQQTDIDAGAVLNSATATGSSPGGTDDVSDVSDDPNDATDTTDTDGDGDAEDDTSTALAQDPNIALLKSGVYSDTNGDSIVNVGDEILYTFEVENTGNVDLTNITISDPLLVAPNGSISGGPINLAVGAIDTSTFTGVYAIQQTDIDAGAVLNSATATGSSPGGTDDVSDVSDDPNDATDTTDTDGDGDAEDDTSTALAQDPNIALLKSGVYDDANNDGLVNVGDEILYTFEVENTGNVDLTNITISDPLLVAPNGSISGGPINLAVGAIDTSTFTGVYAIQQTDIDAGAVLNSATATGSSPGGTDDVSDVSDDPNDATDTTDTDGDGDAEDDTSTALAQDPNIALLKSGVYSDTNGDSIVNVGDEILYTFEVENTGNVDLTNITISDPLLVAPNGSISGGPINLAVGAIDTSTFTGVYAIQQTDIDAGAVLNSATATGSSPGGTDDVSDVSDDPNDATDTTDTDGDGDAEDDTSTALAQDPNIALLKSGVYSDTNGDSIVNVGDEILYTFEVENTGNVDLTNITISDPLLVAPNGSISGGPINLAVGAIDTSTFTGVYAIQQTDIDAGAVLNSATATGSSPGGTDDVSDVSDDPNDATDTTDTDGDGDAEDDTSTALAQDPNIALLKSGVYDDANNDGLVNVGDEILYTFEVENTGNVDLTNITISDPLLVAPNGSISGGPINLAVGAIDTSTFTGVYAIQQTDIDAGAVLNSATATGSSPGGTDDVSDVSDDPNDATDTTDTDGDGDAEDDTSTALAQDPNIALLKSGVYDDANNDGLVNIGDEILYTFEIENTGNVDLTNITISDPLLVAPNGSISGGPINLAVGAIDTSTFTGVYAIQQTDIDAGAVLNSATATGSSPGGTDDVSDVSDDPNDATDTTDTDGDGDAEDDTSTALAQDPNIALLKSGVYSDTNGDSIVNVGDEILYTFEVENTGNVDLTNITISDPLLVAPNGSISGGPINLAVGAIDTSTFTGVYAIQQTDIDAGAVLNSATATGSSPGGTDDVSDVSDDPNDATDTTDTDGDGDAEDDTSTALAQDPNIALLKSGVYSDTNGDSIVNIGDEILYTFEIENTGNVDLTNITISDPLLVAPNGSISGGPINLAVGAIDTSTFTGVYAIQQTDIDAGAVLNSATATGSSPGGTDDVSDVSDDPNDATDTTDTDGDGDAEDDTSTALAQDPNIALLKSGVYSDTNGDSIVNIGDEILYTFEVENTGNVDLTNITISDPLLVAPNGSISGGPINLAVGAIDTSTFTGVYAIQQTDIDAGAVLNSATATGSSPGGTDDVSDVSDDPNDATDTTDTDGDGDAEDDTSTALAQDPNIALLKSGVYSDTNGDSIVNIGDEILYTFEVENTGNVDLTNITISDPLLVAPNGSISGGPINLAVGAIDTSTFTGVYAIQQTDIDAGAVLNSATATGSSPGGTDDVSDVSDDPNDATDTTDTDGDGDAEDDTSTALAQDPNIALLKSGVYSDTNGDSIVNVGDEILYTFEVENTGNVDLTNITISDPLLVAPNGSISGGPINLAVGAIDTSTFTGVYAIQQTDIDAGAVLNSATATGSSPGGTDDVSDVSDDPNDATDTTDTDGDGDAEDDTSTALAQDPNIALLKSGVYSDTNGDSIVNIGDEILYTFEVENTGNVDLTNITISDPLLVAPNGSISGGPINLAVGAIDTSTFTGVYAIQQTDIDAGAVLNSATATGSSPGGTDDVSDVSDDPNDVTDTTDTDGDGDAEDDTSTALAQDPSIEIIANNDTFAPIEIDENNGAISPNVVDANDEINGISAVLGATVSIANIVDLDPNDGVTLDPLTGEVTIDPFAIPGDYVITYTICSIADPTVCDDATVTVVVPGNIIITDDEIAVFNFISRNNPDGLNDRLVFQGLENVNNDVVRIYNRWGVKVFETRDYGQNGNFFRGISTGRTTINEVDQLPTGTYYYVLEYELMDGTPRNKAGYIYIN